MIVSAHDGYPRWIDAGADYIEVDVRRSRDGVLVLAHDDLRAGVRYPTLEELLTRMHGPTGLQLDLKEEGSELEIVEAALRRVPAERLAVTTGVDAALRRVKSRFPGVRTGLTRQHVERTGHDFMALDQRYASGEALDFCAAHGIPVWLWTVDDEAALRRLLEDRRVAGVITNRPDVALRLRSARS